ncbi:Membrane protein involved in the export of O-antigen and teichoic acid [Nonlabens sp. Hel1_33_55]|uniref:oligosaccharide flippase family protein n=1 Tax=Nonlabens sp. Hel1_33_55 TaxID=1336802 RepID=UPI000875C44D|nr:oligosaccharide flippase family protein [Nonlabens sp. Hel1_33_55]SCX99273.1 Membrane protein involved in the export of O-antigen and teichoic acid [Nonlabens sp. Hel1_33_55]
MTAIILKLKRTLSPQQIFMASAFIVNAGNYAYNLMLGRLLGPRAFADAVILITLLLVLSFVAMTFQLTVAKYMVELHSRNQNNFIQQAYKYALMFGLVLGAAVVIFAPELQSLFQTESSLMFTIFGAAVPLYFIMSVNRGKLQGDQSFVELSMTYQLEMLWRLGLTFAFLLFLSINPAIAVSISIAISFIAGLFPFKKVRRASFLKFDLTVAEKKNILRFFLLTAFYELTQIVCNNSDILMVKHYFDSYDAGLYSSLALIGRVVYFVTWMFVMLLLPAVIESRKQGKNPVPVLKKYVGYITALSAVIVSFTFLFPEFAVQLLFGEEYLSIAPLLGWYALATSFFAVSNIFAYYFLSLDHYKPVIIAGVFGLLQVYAISLFHDSLFQVTMAQVLVMSSLLMVQLGYFMIHHGYLKKANRLESTTHLH